MNLQTLFVYSHVDGVIIAVGHISNVRIRVTVNTNLEIVGTGVRYAILK